MAISVSAGQIILASHYRSIKSQADNQLSAIRAAPWGSNGHSHKACTDVYYDTVTGHTDSRGGNTAYRPHYNYNFSRLRVSTGEIIYAWKLNELSSTISAMSAQDCRCDCNYCTCDCDYCGCDCDYCTCDCFHCTCDCNWNCTCDCNRGHKVFWLGLEWM